VKAVFECPWGCAEVSRAERSGLVGSFFHENAWECPMFSQRLLRAVELLGQKLNPGDSGTTHSSRSEAVQGS
jgi:hypothetical protein